MSPAEIASGVLQGLLEWLPVSSTGVLVVAGFGYTRALSLHLYTSISALVYILASRRSRLDARRLLEYGALPLLFGAPVALALEELAKSLGEDSLRRATILLYAATIAALTARMLARCGRGRLEPRLGDLALVGFLEGIAVLPGVSRSGLVLAYTTLACLDSRTAVQILMASGVFAGFAAGAYEAMRGGAAPPALGIVAFASSLPALYLLERIGDRGLTALTIATLTGVLASGVLLGLGWVW